MGLATRLRLRGPEAEYGNENKCRRDEEEKKISGEADWGDAKSSSKTAESAADLPTAVELIKIAEIAEAVAI